MTFHVYTDGSSDPLTKAGGYAAVVARQDAIGTDFKLVKEESHPFVGTSNVAEIEALRLGLMAAAELAEEASSVTLFTDSNNAIGWVTRKFRPGEAIEESLHRLLSAIEGLKRDGLEISICKTDGHAGQRFNERAHDLAGRAMRSAPHKEIKL